MKSIDQFYCEDCDCIRGKLRHTAIDAKHLLLPLWAFSSLVWVIDPVAERGDCNIGIVLGYRQMVIFANLSIRSCLFGIKIAWMQKTIIIVCV